MVDISSLLYTSPALRLIAMVRWILILAVLAQSASREPKRVLYITHSAGFRHDCLPVSQQVMADIAARTGKLEVTATEDLDALNNSRRMRRWCFSPVVNWR